MTSLSSRGFPIRFYLLKRRSRRVNRPRPLKLTLCWKDFSSRVSRIKRTGNSPSPTRLQISTKIDIRPRALSFDPDDYFETEDERILPSSNGTGVNWPSDGTSTSEAAGEGTHGSAEMSGDTRFFGFLDDKDGDVPKTWYHKALWLWERPVMKLGRLTVFFAQLPALFTFLASQVAVLVGQITLPMLPPLLLGAGILLRTIWVNAGHLFPRVSLTMVLLWGIWFLNSLAYRTIAHLTNQGTLSQPSAHTIMNWAEGLTLVTAGLVMLSLFGVNISGLLLPAGVCLALAAKDLAHNFLAGIVLFLAQPFRVGDEVMVQPQSGQRTDRNQKWYEGICERVDLRYTVLRRGRYKLHVPNSSFITKEFMVLDQSYDPEERDEPSEDPPSEEPLSKTKSAVEFTEGRRLRDACGRVEKSLIINGSPVDEEDLPSDVDYPKGDLYTSDLTDATPETP